MGGGVTRREFGLRPCLACCLNAHFLSKLVDAKQTLNFLVRLSFQIVVLTRQGPRFSIRMVIGIFCSDTETGAVTPPGVMQKK